MKLCDCGKLRDAQLEMAKLSSDPEVVGRLVKISNVQCQFCEAREKFENVPSVFLNHLNLTLGCLKGRC